MKYNVNTIEEYLNLIPSDRKEILKKIIKIINEYFPDIKGSMKYDMPTFDPVCAVASQKHHISIYIHHFSLLDKYRNELNILNVGKSCIRFKKMDDFPEAVLRKIFSDIEIN